jgi:hypothetical protein
MNPHFNQKVYLLFQFKCHIYIPFVFSSLGIIVVLAKLWEKWGFENSEHVVVSNFPKLLFINCSLWWLPIPNKMFVYMCWLLTPKQLCQRKVKKKCLLFTRASEKNGVVKIGNKFWFTNFSKHSLVNKLVWESWTHSQ